MSFRRQFSGIAILTALTCPPGWSEPLPESVVDLAQTEVVVPESPKEQALKELEQGRELMRKGFAESAIVHYRKAIELDPQLIPAYEELGKILLDTQNQAFAITIYSKLAELQPQNPQWKEILADLYVAYDMPGEAVRVNEDLLQLNPGNAELMRKLADLYKKNGLEREEAGMLDRLAQNTQEGRDYYRAGEAWLTLGEPGEGIRNYQLAAKKDPSNLDYQNGLGKAYIAGNRSSSAVELYQGMVKSNPEAPGLKDRLGEARIAQGDKLMQKQRYAAARQEFLAAKELGGATAAEEKLQERIRKSERLNSVRLNNTMDTGRFAGNYYTWMQNIVNMPMQDQDLTFQVLHDYRNASAAGFPDAQVSSVAGGVRYMPDENYELFAQAGTNQYYNAGVNYSDDTLAAGARVRRELWFLTPRALGERYRGTILETYADWQALPWLSLHGDIGTWRFDDGLQGLVYNVGPFFLPVNRPGEVVWGVGYTHGGVQYNRDGDPTRIFAPTNLQVDSFGTELQHWLGRDFKYTLGYFYSILNDNAAFGPNGHTFLVGVDAQLGEGSFFRARYEYGNFVLGRLNPGFLQGTNNYRYTGELQFTF